MRGHSDIADLLAEYVADGGGGVHPGLHLGLSQRFCGCGCCPPFAPPPWHVSSVGRRVREWIGADSGDGEDGEDGEDVDGDDGYFQTVPYEDGKPQPSTATASLASLPRAGGGSTSGAPGPSRSAHGPASPASPSGAALTRIPEVVAEEEWQSALGSGGQVASPAPSAQYYHHGGEGCVRHGVAGTSLGATWSTRLACA